MENVCLPVQWLIAEHPNLNSTRRDLLMQSGKGLTICIGWNTPHQLPTQNFKESLSTLHRDLTISGDVLFSFNLALVGSYHLLVSGTLNHSNKNPRNRGRTILGDFLINDVTQHVPTTQVKVSRRYVQTFESLKHLARKAAHLRFVRQVVKNSGHT